MFRMNCFGVVFLMYVNSNENPLSLVHVYNKDYFESDFEEHSF